MLDTTRQEPAPQAAEVQGPSNRTLKRWGIGAAIVALAVAAVGIGTRIHSEHALQATTAQAAIPVVTVVSPSHAETSALVLPGTVEAYNSAAIFARTNGYVRRWLVDIGQKVHAGEVLATLDAPDLDQQLAQAKADYLSALANQQLAQVTARRWATLLAQDAVSRQESDEKAGDFAAKRALTNAALANVRRLEALEGFTRLTAPFAGVVSSRATQIGQLVVAGVANAQPLFTISDVHRMRIYVRVPQGHSAQVYTGMAASVTVPEYPNRKFMATLVHNAGAVDAQSGSVLVELQADNPDGALKPGAFAQVSFDGGGAPQTGGRDHTAGGGDLSLPGSAILYTDKGPAVVVVDDHGKVTVKPVVIARDLGATVLISGLTPNLRIVDSPPDSIRTGDQVRVAAPGKSTPNEG